MIYYIQEFDPKPAISHAQMVEIYNRFTDGCQRAWPSNKMIGLFSRRYGLGPDPQYMAIWEIPNFAAFDEWRGKWEEVKSYMQEIEDDFFGSTINLRGRVMDRLDF